MNYLSEIISVFAASVLPAVLLMGYIMWKDRNQPEPFKLIIRGFLYGGLAAFVASFLNGTMTALLSPFISIPVIGSFVHSFCVAGLDEECTKLFFFWLLVRNNPYFDERFDGVVYCVSVGLGFAAIENLDYVIAAYPDWTGAAFSRGLLSVPGHYAFAVIMGALYGLVHFEPRKYSYLRPWILIAPITAHGIYDSCCFLSEEFTDSLPSVSKQAFCILIIFCLVMHRWVAKRLDRQLMKDGVIDGHKQTSAAHTEVFEDWNKTAKQRNYSPSSRMLWIAIILTCLMLSGSYTQLKNKIEIAHFTGWGCVERTSGIYEGDIVDGSCSGLCHDAFGDSLSCWYEGEWADSIGSVGLGMEYIPGNRTYYGHWADGCPVDMGIMLRNDSIIFGLFDKEQCVNMDALLLIDNANSTINVGCYLLYPDRYLDLLDSIQILQDTILARHKASGVDNQWADPSQTVTVKEMRQVIEKYRQKYQEDTVR